MKKQLPFKIQFRVIVEPDGAGFHAYVPDLKGVHAAGDTQDEALRYAVDGVAVYMRSLVKHGEPIPVGMLVRDEDLSFVSAMIGLIRERLPFTRKREFVKEVAINHASAHA